MNNQECPKCSGSSFVKDGFVRKKQRYKCKKCNFRHTVRYKSGAELPEIKRQALHLYLEGLGFRSIGRILKYSNVSVLNWIKSFGQQVQDIKSEKEICKMEVDEMHTYVSKKTINRYGYLLIELEKSSLILQ